MTRPTVAPRYSPVRYKNGEWEMRCNACTQRGGMRFWPIDLEFWTPSNMTTCRACLSDRRRRSESARRSTYYRLIKSDPVKHAAYLARHRVSQQRLRDRRRRELQAAA